MKRREAGGGSDRIAAPSCTGAGKISFWTWSTYIQSVSRKKQPLNTSLRSETQATDSTRNGCQANNAATTALRQNAPVIAFNNRRSSIALAQWSNTLTMWGGPAFNPNNWQSSMCESQVSGCQLLACWSTKDQTTPHQLKPARTVGLLNT